MEYGTWEGVCRVAGKVVSRLRNGSRFRNVSFPCCNVLIVILISGGVCSFFGKGGTGERLRKPILRKFNFIAKYRAIS